MSSEKKIISNRRNEQKSTGPRTSAGKAAISKNAVKHGLLASQAVISSESREDFDIHRDRTLRDLVPESPLESMLAERIVVLSWRLQRIGCIQAQTIDALIARITSGPLTKLTQSLLFKKQKQSQTTPSTSANDLALGSMAIKDFSNSRVLDRLLMNERRIESSFFKTIFELKRLQFMRKLQNQEGPDQETEYQSLLGGQL